MKKNTALNGYLFAFLATVTYSHVYIFSKAALNELPLAQFGSLWYFVVAVLCLSLAIKNKKIKQIKTLSKKQVGVLVMLGFLEIVTTTSFFLSIHIIPDPAVTSFLGNMFPVMVMLGGIFILGERFVPVEIFGGLLALAGAFLISYTGGATIQTLFVKGTGIVFLNAVFAASATLVVKVHVKKLSPELLNLNRSVWLLAFSIIMFLALNRPAPLSATAARNLGVGAVLEFSAILMIYHSMRYIEASRSSVVQSLKGIFVLTGSYFFFGTLPLVHQFIGGMVTVAGVLLMALAQAGIFRKKEWGT